MPSDADHLVRIGPLLAQPADLVQPARPVRHRRGACGGQRGGGERLEVGQDGRDAGDPVVHLAGIAVDLDDRPAGPERLRLRPGLPDVQAAAQDEQEVAAPDRQVRPAVAVAPDHADPQVARRRHDVDAHERVHDRDAQRRQELADRFGGAGRADPAADEDQRSLGTSESGHQARRSRPGRRPDRATGRSVPGASSGTSIRWMSIGMSSRTGPGRPLSAVSKDRRSISGSCSGVCDLPGGLGDRRGERDDLGLLEAHLADRPVALHLVAVDLAGDEDRGRRVEVAAGDRRSAGWSHPVRSWPSRRRGRP